MNENGKAQQNMISNLPLLFANGYPTSLEKITETQLENFIPFMVQCSLGHINFPKKKWCSEPEWWPENLPFKIPLTKPKDLSGSWMEKMKEIVVICYQFHKSLFLLRFCNDLATYEQASLRFINNYNSTTSLYDRRSNKLLVTFRNENMSYDQQQRTRKCLMKRKATNGCHDVDDPQQIMVEPAPFDIYLCDNCDAELYSKEAIEEHEKTCNVDADVILCDSPEPELEIVYKNENDELRRAFLLNFNLNCRISPKTLPILNQTSSSSSATLPHKEDKTTKVGSTNRSSRLSRRNRSTYSLTRCPSIPLSSPAGQQLLRTTKMTLTADYLSERLERVERFCHTPLLTKSTQKPRIFDKRPTRNNLHCTYKKPAEYSTHIYVFPRRQYAQRRWQSTAQSCLFLNAPLIKQCRPISVRIKKISENELTYQRSTVNANINIRLTRDTAHTSNWRIFPTTADVIVDTIDLCSSDDEDNANVNTVADANANANDYNDNSANAVKTIPLNGITTNGMIIGNTTATTNVLANNCDNSNTSLIKIIPSLNETLLAGKRVVVNTTTSSSSGCSSSNNVLPTNLTNVTADSFSDQKSLKPLRQSVYIFSNYKTDSNLNRYVVDTSTLPPTSRASISNAENNVNGLAACHHQHHHTAEPKEYYQENCSSTTKNLITVADWFSNTNNGDASNHHQNNNNNNNKNNSSINQSHTINTENLSVVHPSFSSPARIISIDLTT